MPELRPIQQQARDKIRQAFREGHRRILAIAPTGFGKTVLLADIISSHLVKAGPDARALVVVHRRELIGQTHSKLLAAGADRARLDVRTVQSLLAHEDADERTTMLILDEAHHYVADEWKKIVAALPDAIVIGFTATPMRDDGTPLGDIFTSLVVCAQTKEMIGLGFLSKVVVYAAMRKTKDDSETALEAYQARASGRPTVVFCQSVAAAYQTAQDFCAAGIPAACIEGKTAAPLRDSLLAQFASGELQVLTNVFVLTEGWDCPRAEVCILARGCGSVAAYLQMVGRVLRPSSGKEDAMLIDLRGAVHKHGLPDQVREFSLEGKPISGKDAPTKSCPQCGRELPISAMECPCGYKFEGADRSEEPDQAPVILIESVPTEGEQWREWLETAHSKGYKLGWVARKFVEKYGRFPRKLWRETMSTGGWS